MAVLNAAAVPHTAPQARPGGEGASPLFGVCESNL